MEFSKQQADALDCLYGNSSPAMCAVTQDMQLLWSNRCFEQRFLLLVQAAGEASDHVVLQNCMDIPLFDGNEYIYCTVEKMFLSSIGEAPKQQPDTVSLVHIDEADPEPDYYLLRFRTEPVLSLTHDAGTEMLISCAGECRAAAEQSLYALNEVHQLVTKNRCNDMSIGAIDQMLAACYRFLNQAVRFEELSWYGDADMHRIGEDEPLAFTVYLRTLFQSIGKVAGDLLPVTYTADDEPVWVKVNEERLMFTVLSLFQAVHQSSTPGCRIIAHCGRENDYAVLTMRAEKSSGNDSGRVHALNRSYLDETPLSNEALMRRFCKQYGARITLQPGVAGKVYALRIPLTEQHGITFESTANSQDDGHFGTVGTMLSAMVDFHHTGGI